MPHKFKVSFTNLVVKLSSPFHIAGSEFNTRVSCNVTSTKARLASDAKNHVRGRIGLNRRLVSCVTRESILCSLMDFFVKGFAAPRMA